MATTGDSTIANLVSAIVKNHRFQAHDLFSWLLDDLLADLTTQRKKSPPPAEAMDSIRELAKLYAGCAIALPCCEDILGPVYQEVSGQGQKRWMGQYFTPQPIARMMANMTLAGMQSGRDPNRLTTIFEPCSGSGVMLLAMCQEIIQSQNVQALAGYSFTAIDLDGYCARMTAVQLLVNCYVHNLTFGEVLVYQGNSLFPDSELSVIVHGTAPGVDLSQVAPPLHPVRIEAIRQSVASNDAAQLDLWG